MKKKTSQSRRVWLATKASTISNQPENETTPEPERARDPAIEREKRAGLTLFPDVETPPPGLAQHQTHEASRGTGSAPASAREASAPKHREQRSRGDASVCLIDAEKTIQNSGFRFSSCTKLDILPILQHPPPCPARAARVLLLLLLQPPFAPSV